MPDLKQFSKRTKIIATVGPASWSSDVISKMIQNGVDMFRLNASHNAEAENIKTIVTIIREESQKADKHVGIFMDLQGPKIRVGKIENDGVMLEEGKTIQLTTEKQVGNADIAYVSYPGIVRDVEIGDPVFIDDGKIRMVVQKKLDNAIECKILRGGKLSNHKGVNLPETDYSESPFTTKDQEDTLVAIANSVDYIALSFVSKSEDVQNFRQFLLKHNVKNIHIIAKIERQQAVDNLASIIDEADAVMVARGDLGVEIGVEKVPQIQKQIIRECNRRIKPVIVATQMLESMIQSEVATRAEVSDIANAIYDHCDAVMLSGETAVGINPANVIEVMANICKASDRHMIEIKKEDREFRSFRFLHHTIATSLCQAADQVAEENNAAAVMAFTSSGNTPLIASKLNSILPIIAPTDEIELCRRMSLYRGVIPLMLKKKFKDIHRWTDMIHSASKEAIEYGLLKKDDRVVVTAGIPIGQSGGVNSIRIITA